MTGAAPFPRRTGQQPGERILQVLREQVAPVRDALVPAELSDVVTRLLAKDPSHRPQEASALAELFENLRRAMDGSAVTSFKTIQERGTGDPENQRAGSRY